MQTIYLDSDDDIISVCDRLEWADSQQILFVVPENEDLLHEQLDLIRLRRHADRLRIDFGLISSNWKLRRRAMAVGIPIFPSVEKALSNPRGWWRGRRRREKVGLATGGRQNLTIERKRLPRLRGDKLFSLHKHPPIVVQPRQWLLRYMAILLFCLAIAFLYAGFLYTVPRATLTLNPETVPLQIEQQLVADPTLADIDFEQKLLPARLLTSEVSWESEIKISGTIDVATASARGAVVVTNLLSETVNIPIGTQFSTDDNVNLLFQTIAAATLPNVAGSTTEVEVVAVMPGSDSNVTANQINQVLGELVTQIGVNNPTPMTGGGVRQETAVSPEDQSRLHAQVVQFLHALAASEMEAQLTESQFLARDSLRVLLVISETYSHAVGEQTDRLSLKMVATVQGTAVDTAEASGLLVENLAGAVPDQFTLVPESIQFNQGDVLAVDEVGRVTFVMVGEALAAAALNLDAQIEQITGQETDRATTFLAQGLPLRKRPLITTWPVWFNRVPYSASRIELEVIP